MSLENSDSPFVSSPSALPAQSDPSPAARTFADVLNAMAESLAQLSKLVSSEQDELIDHNNCEVVVDIAPVRSEARRLEESYRSRYAENALAMTAVYSVIDSGNPDVKEPITRGSLQMALKNVQTLTTIEPDFAVQFMADAKYLIDRWNDMNLSPYKAKDGSITAKSAAAGKERMLEEQEAIAKRIVAAEINTRVLERSAKPAEAIPVKTIEPKAAIVKQAEARAGEGPYQVAARVLGSDGQPVDVDQLKELTEAFKKVFEDEPKSQPFSCDYLGVRVGHQFLNKINAGKVLGLVTDPALRRRMEGILNQNRIVPAPVIKPIPPRFSSSLPNDIAEQSSSRSLSLSH